MIARSEDYTPAYSKEQLAPELQHIRVCKVGDWRPIAVLATTAEVYSVAATIDEQGLPAIAENYRTLAKESDSEDPDKPVGDEFVIFKEQDAQFLQSMAAITLGIEIADVDEFPTGSDLTLAAVEKPFEFQAAKLEPAIATDEVETNESHLFQLSTIRNRVVIPASKLVKKIVHLAA